MASEQVDTGATSIATHPTGGRKRRAKGPPAPSSLPELPPLPRGSDSSGDLEEEKGEAKHLRSTPTTPRSESLRANDPFEYDQIVGINAVGPSKTSEEGDAQEATDEEGSQPNKPLQGATPRLDPYSGVGEGSRGYGSLLEVLNTQRIARLELCAACASQVAIEFRPMN